MRNPQFKTLIGLVVSLMFLSDIRAADLYPYLDDLETARAEARKKQLPLLIVFRCEP